MHLLDIKKKELTYMIVYKLFIYTIRRNLTCYNKVTYFIL